MKHSFLIIILVFSAAINVSGQCSEADIKALEAFDQAWSKAGESGNRTALMNIYADDYVGLPAKLNKTKTIENTIKASERNKANPKMADKVTADNYMITCTPTTATITHRNVITTPMGAGGREETFYTRSIHVLEKRNGRWQVVGNVGHGLDDYDLLSYMELDWGNAIKNKDTVWFDRNVAADYREVDLMDGKVRNKADAMKAMKADKTVTNSFNTEEMNIRIDGNTAVVTGLVHVLGRDEKGQPMDMRVRYTDTFIKRDGRWQAWASQAMIVPKQ